jgi:hypothetical protein
LQRLSAADEQPPLDPKDLLWRDGLAILRTFTRHAEASNRKLAVRPLLLEQPNGAAEDPWGINAWIARQPDIEVKPDATGIPGACLNGWMVVSAAKDIADKAGPATVLAGQLGRHGRA